MQTTFTPDQLRDPAVAESERILRACVHCGFCTATCPTYVLLGDELDSPRGRIYLIKDMLENDRPATPGVVKHIDRCLSCLACMTTCPSGVHYMHLVDHARFHIEETYRRPWQERALRTLIAKVLPYPGRFRLALRAASFVRPFGSLLGLIGVKRVASMLRLAKAVPPQADTLRRHYPAVGERRGRVALLVGCANPVLRPSINEAAIRVLTRHGVEVVVPKGEGCCGALVHHLGRERESLDFARRNVDVWSREIEDAGLDAILITASGCGTTVKDYGFMLRTDASYATKAARIAALTKDISEYLMTLELTPPVRNSGLRIAYQAACSLQHGQRIVQEPRRLLARAGYAVSEVPEGHLCCGSAGTYNILQPDLARQLGRRKAENIAKVAPDVIATGNIGCMAQLATVTATPIAHVVELIDWATGGPPPAGVQPRQAEPVPERVT